MTDLTCIVRRPASVWRGWSAHTVICGQAVVERYLRCGYEFDWPATDEARAKATTYSSESDPGSAAYEAARARLVATLSEIGLKDARNGFSRLADAVRNGEAVDIPSWVAMQLMGRDL